MQDVNTIIHKIGLALHTLHLSKSSWCWTQVIHTLCFIEFLKLYYHLKPTLCTGIFTGTYKQVVRKVDKHT